MSQENLSSGNCVAATAFPQEIMSLTINVATVYPIRKFCRQEILSLDMDRSEYDVQYCYSFLL